MRKPRIGLRSSLLLLAVIAVGLAFSTRQQRVGSRLRALGAKLTYRYQYDDWEDTDHYSFAVDAKLSALGQLLGADLTSTIVTVQSSMASDPSEIAILASQLPRLRSLSIQDSAFTDSDLIPISRMKRLRGLHLVGTRITDVAVERLAEMPQLIVLNVRDTDLSDDAISRLRIALPKTRVHSGVRQGGHYVIEGCSYFLALGESPRRNCRFEVVRTGWLSLIYASPLT